MIRNKGAVSDFNLIKDIVDRNHDTIDEEISNQLPIPLYLGLMGTMIGIVIGLIFIPEITDKETIGSSLNGINILLGGVKIAMVASFTGLLMTVIGTGYLYKGAKTKAEKGKNTFFNFVQTDLLPVLSQNVTTSIYSLQTNLLKFNDTFETNISQFNGLLTKILISFDSQVQLVEELKRVDVAEVAKYNTKVLVELRKSMIEFEKFTMFLNQLNTFVDNTKQLNENVASQLNSTIDIQNIAKTLEMNVVSNKFMIEQINQNTESLRKRDKLIDSSFEVLDTALEKSLKQFSDHTQNNLTRYKEAIDLEQDLIQKLLEKDRGNFDELKKLSAMKTGVDDVHKELRSLNSMQGRQIELLDKLVNKIDKLNDKESNPLKLPNALKIGLYIFIGAGAIIGSAVIINYVINLIK